MRFTFPRALFAFGIVSAIASALPAFADPDLGQVCAQYGSNGQMSNLCQAAFKSGNTSFVMDNNARVWGSVAVVNAVGCMSGDPGACPTAVDSGNHAYASHNSSNNAFHAAQDTGSSALSLASSAKLVGGGVPTQVPGTGDYVAGPMPSSCVSAITGGGVSDRIACAVATDPAIPPSVQSPKFLQDFQNATGYSLQSVINQSQKDLVGLYPSALNHAYDSVKGKVSLADFAARKDQLAAAFAQGFQSNSATQYAQAQPAQPAQMQQDPAGQGALSAEVAASRSIADQAGSGTQLAHNTDSSDDSLFIRVSRKYQAHSWSLVAGYLP